MDQFQNLVSDSRNIGSRPNVLLDTSGHIRNYGVNTGVKPGIRRFTEVGTPDFKLETVGMQVTFDQQQIAVGKHSAQPFIPVERDVGTL